MKRKIVTTSRFKRSLRKFVKENQRIERQIAESLSVMANDVYTPNLATHRLKGNIDMDTGQEVIVLLNVGSHDDVY